MLRKGYELLEQSPCRVLLARLLTGRLANGCDLVAEISSISSNEKFYKQEYCEFSYSLRDSNEWRKANGIPKIQIGGDTAGLGERYFTDPLVDAAEESQEVVDEFLAQANEIAKADRSQRQEAFKVYKHRRKTEACDGSTHGLNNW